MIGRRSTYSGLHVDMVTVTLQDGGILSRIAAGGRYRSGTKGFDKTSRQDLLEELGTGETLFPCLLPTDKDEEGKWLLLWQHGQ